MSPPSAWTSKSVLDIFDPSELYRPDIASTFLPSKAADQYRNYESNKADPIQKRVEKTYLEMHTYQTYSFVKERSSMWCKFDKMQMPIMEALDLLNELVDESDPDVDFPNIYHGFQTAEMIRQAHPDKPWLQLTGLIHDLGKLMAVLGESQWCVVGDTFPVGCAVGPSVVYAESTFRNNPDIKHPIYSTRNGVYEEGCGLDKVMMSWGHDEYMYRVLKNHKGCRLPEEALYVIRFHSFYPWHTGGDYYHLCNEKDLRMLEWIREFNKFDLYTKCEVLPEIEELKPYYQALIDQYIPASVRW